jgi:hypothetical protein
MSCLPRHTPPPLTYDGIQCEHTTRSSFTIQSDTITQPELQCVCCTCEWCALPARQVCSR